MTISQSLVDAISMASMLIEDMHDSEYARGVCEIIAEIYGVEDYASDCRALDIAALVKVESGEYPFNVEAIWRFFQRSCIDATEVAEGDHEEMLRRYEYENFGDGFYYIPRKAATDKDAAIIAFIKKTL